MSTLVEPVADQPGGGDPADLVVVSRDAQRLGRQRIWPRAVVLLAASVVAFGYSLSTTMHSLGGDTPLAYLGLVPLIALVIGLSTVTPAVGDADVHDRYLDRILGAPLLVTSLLVMVVLPPRLSTFFWLWRIDLLVFPLFVAGLVALLFGTRTLLRTKAAIAFLLLAWPVPYQATLTLGLDRFTAWSVGAVRLALRAVPLAEVSRGVEGGFRISGAGGSFDLVVASQCSGANGLVGFLLVAGATMIATVGRPARKLAWLVAGAALVWLMNVVRILVIFAAGKMWGETVAVEGFHPYVGLVTFALSTAVMVWALPRFGLTFGRRSAGPDALAASVHRAVPRWRTTAACLLALAVVVGTFDTELRDYDPVVSALGAPRLAPFGDIVNEVDGYRGVPVDRFDWAKRYFGEDADWTRYEFSGTGSSTPRLDGAITADVVTTTDVQSFNDFGVEACYRFHGYDVESTDQVDLGAGQQATVLTWRDPRSATTWTALYWFWPVKGGDLMSYQRVILLDDSTDDDARQDLTGFGRALVTASIGGS